MKDKDFINKAKEKASNIISNVSKKTEYIAKLTRLKLSITSYKTSIKKHYKNMGQYIYKNQDEFKDNTEIKKHLEQINQLQAKIEETLEKLEELKKLQEQNKEEEDR